MEALEKFTLMDLKVYRDLLETRIAELRHHQIDEVYFPPYTDKEIGEIKLREQQTMKALSLVNKSIRQALDAFIASVPQE